MKGRPVDPRRKKRQTGHHGKPGELKVVRINAQPEIAWPPPAPDDLPDGAKLVWESLVEDIPPIARISDLETFRLMCLAAFRARQAGQRIDQYGVIVQGQRGPMVNPAMKLERDATATFLKLAEQIGLTIAARLRLGVVAAQGATLQQQLAEKLGRRK